MAILQILHYPDPRLRDKAAHIENIDRALRRFIDDMLETMYDAPGVGLAATQVGVARRIAVMDCSEKKNEPMVMINPQILWSEQPAVVDEGCLSVPEHYDQVTRYKKVGMRAMDVHGERYELHAEGLQAQCIQHEIGHLDGGLYIDLLSRLKQHRIRRKLEKTMKEKRKA
ncbi:MAG: peptide deformylase [Salinisphaera sp.]|nr:peptide deformylase [Salinisphaera sp.]